MKQLFRASIVAIVSLSMLASAAVAYVIIRPLTEAYLGDTSYWPTGLKQLAERYKCVAGQEIIAPSWGRGTISAQLCFAGDERTFNAFLKEYANVKFEGLSLTLHPGNGAFQSTVQKEKKPVPFDWRLSVSTSSIFKAPDKEIKLGVTYYVGDTDDLSALDISPAITVQAGYDDKYREAHRDDAAVKVIEALIRSRQDRRSPE
jgi:hypothetical protein